MSPIQQMLLGAGGAVAKKTYVDDVFSTYVYSGSSSAQTFNTGVDLANEGGLIWSKYRTMNSPGIIFDTERGKTKFLRTSGAEAEGTSNTAITSFNNNGFSVGGGDGWTNFNANHDFATWIWRKAPGFCDVVAYTGDGSASRQISHSLGSVPGMVIVKNIDAGYNWTVWHKSEPAKAAQLNQTAAFSPTTDYFGNSSGPIIPTSTYFTVNGNAVQNGNGVDYIAYVFAGGESTAATARSVGFSSSSTYLSIPDSNDFDFGSTFTFEAWVKPEFHNGNLNLIFEHGSFQIAVQDDGRLQFDPNHIHTGGDFYSSTGSVPEGQWTHVAVVGTSGTLKMYINGVNDQSHSRTGVDITGDTGAVTISDSTGYYFKGEISNLRIVKGTAVYTSSFRPPTEPLTNITNTKLLCCNNSSTTGSTVTPGTITANGSPSYGYPTAEIDSPFDDPAGHVFGEGDQNIIKCGSYIGTGSANLPVALGWGPQWIMVKKASGSGNWVIIDMMRSKSEPFRERLEANDSNVAFDATSPLPITHEPGFIPKTALGFKVRGTDSDVNTDGSTYIYMAIRQDAGLVKRPPSLGTEVFAMASETGDDKPSFVSGFPVNFALDAIPTSTEEKRFSSRTAGPTPIFTSSTNAGGSNNRYRAWDVMNGFGQDFNSYSTNYFAWMWRSYSGAVSQSYDGSGSVMEIPHLLGQTPEMMFIKGVEFGTGSTQNWAVYHKALGATKYMSLNSHQSPYTDSTVFNDTAPTSTHVTVGTSNKTNFAGSSPPTIYRMMLFASVAGISKIDSYDGSDSDLTVTVGFQPRFIMIKSTSSYRNWLVVDTVRGWGSGNDKIVRLNTDSSTSDADVGTPTSTGFTLTGNNDDWNKSGKSYIYYAHA